MFDSALPERPGLRHSNWYCYPENNVHTWLARQAATYGWCTHPVCCRCTGWAITVQENRSDRARTGDFGGNAFVNSSEHANCLQFR